MVLQNDGSGARGQVGQPLHLYLQDDGQRVHRRAGLMHLPRLRQAGEQAGGTGGKEVAASTHVTKRA